MKPFLLLATRAEDVAADGEYRAFLRHSGLTPAELIRHRLEREPLGRVDLADYSGIILGGSPFNASEPEDTKTDVQRRVDRQLSELLDVIVAEDYPFLGACYGVGTLGLHEGATVDDTYSEPVGAVSISITAAGKSDPLLTGLPDIFEAFVGHKEAIRTLPDHAALLASSPTCPVQMFRVGANVYATQFHPELDTEVLCDRVEVYRHAGYFPPEDADRVKQAARTADVRYPFSVLRTFVRRYARESLPIRSRTLDLSASDTSAGGLDNGSRLGA